MTDAPGPVAGPSARRPGRPRRRRRDRGQGRDGARPGRRPRRARRPDRHAHRPQPARRGSPAGRANRHVLPAGGPDLRRPDPRRARRRARTPPHRRPARRRGRPLPGHPPVRQEPWRDLPLGLQPKAPSGPRLLRRQLPAQLLLGRRRRPSRRGARLPPSPCRPHPRPRLGPRPLARLDRSTTLRSSPSPRRYPHTRLTQAVSRRLAQRNRSSKSTGSNYGGERHRDTPEAWHHEATTGSPLPGGSGIARGNVRRRTSRPRGGRVRRLTRNDRRGVWGGRESARLPSWLIGI